MNISPMLLAVLVGYVACVVLISRATLSALPTLGQLAVLLTYAGMMVSAVGVGAVIGHVLPIAIAIPSALLAQYILVAMPLVVPELAGLRNVFGYGLPLSIDRIGEQFLVAALVAPAVLAVGVAVSFVVVELPTRGRFFLQIAALGLSFWAALWCVADVPIPPVSPRPVSALTCAGDSPEVCMLPEYVQRSEQFEQEAENASDALERLGLARPGRVIVSTENVTGDGVVWWDADPTMGEDLRMERFALGYQGLETCPDIPKTLEELESEEEVARKLGVSLRSLIAGAAPSDEVVAQGVHDYRAWASMNALVCR